ncbi:hypothetical protein BU16DRAFT_617589 [Lophium mytilinum]|uniref:Amino acid transporter n=1 Tax=Lophium mytilinum TaxID=390894 RepID=A0A6A6QWP1_9PEZI|nr:hypothetical protein BU16DRAFT_617589 [Lophium mytilinum]
MRHAVTQLATPDLEASPKKEELSDLRDEASTIQGQVVNETGHVQKVERGFSLWSLTGTGILVGNVWPALGGSILTAIYNGGPPGVLYEFLVASFFYFTVAASLAELASAMPSSAGPYLWASVTPGKRYGRAIGFFAGWWNTLAWTLAAASMSAICGNLIVQMYAFSHPSFSVQPWHVFVTYLLVTWIACSFVCLFNRYMPLLNQIGIFITVCGVFITIIICAVCPSQPGRSGHASNATVWTSWTADTGYPNGFVFIAGMLNGSYAMGTPDSTSHLAEETPSPSTNLPKAIALQYLTGFVSGLAYLITILYAINDSSALLASPFPIAEIYSQATHSTAGTTGLLFLLLPPTFICVIALYMTCGRALWALSRDGAIPLPAFLSLINTPLGLPVNATLTCCGVVTALGCIYVGSSTAFNAFVGSFVLLSSSSYLAALLPLLLRRRRGIEYSVFSSARWAGVFC